MPATVGRQLFGGRFASELARQKRAARGRKRGRRHNKSNKFRARIVPIPSEQQQLEYSGSAADKRSERLSESERKAEVEVAR